MDIENCEFKEATQILGNITGIQVNMNIDPEKIEIDFIESQVTDHSGIEAVQNIAKKYINADKQVKLTHLSPECKELLLKANPKFATIIETSIDDPRYYVVTNKIDEEV